MLQMRKLFLSDRRDDLMQLPVALGQKPELVV